MNNYIVFLRGVNVSGKNIIKMEAFKKALFKNGLSNVQTYIQSGNIFIPNSKDRPEEVKQRIETILQSEFDIETICIVKTAHELKTLVNKIPFSIEDTKQLYFTFTEKNATKEDIDAITNGDYKGDKFSVSNETIYIQCINGFGKTKLNNNFFEKKLNLKATTRNWNTIIKMIGFATKE